MSDPEGVGIVFVDIPDLTGPAASAHDAEAIFELEYWRSLTSGTVSPALAPFVSPELLRKVEAGVQRNQETGWGFDGILRVRIKDVIVEGATATVTTCTDYSEVLFVKADGSAPKTYAEVNFPQHERTTVRLSTSDDGVTWRPEDATLEDSPC